MKNRIFTLFALLCATLVLACSDDETDAATLSTPTDVRLLNRSETSLIFTWDAMPSATHYTYQLIDAEDVTLRVIEVAENTATVADLTEGETYRFRVLASAQNYMRSAYSEYVAAVPGEAMPALAAPEATLEAVTQTTIEVEWTAVEKAVGYEYQLVTAIDGEEVAAGKTTETKYTFTDLVRNTDYIFRVKAIADTASGENSDSAFSADLLAGTESGIEDDGLFKFPNEEKTDGITRAFPGAEGAGMYTTGGRAADGTTTVYRVTNLNDSGAGSLRAAVEASGYRTVVFDVAGVIELEKSLDIKNGNITIAGQTAPGAGICLKNWGVSIKADNVIVRYLRIRPGDGNGNDGLDAIGARYMQNIILDHCSMSWSTDECASFYVNKNMTMQWCLMYESLRNGKHKKGSHGYGGIWGGAPASFHHNVLAHHDSRNPRFDGPEQYADQEQGDDAAKAKGINSTDRLLDFRNNVVYNFCNYGGYGGVGIKMNYIGNYYKWGPASVKGCGPSYKLQGGELVKSANKAVKRDILFMADIYYDGNGLKVPVQGNPSVYIGDNANNKFDTSVPGGNASVGEAVTRDNKTGMKINANSNATITPAWNWSAAQYAVLAGGKACDVTTHAADAAFNLAVKYCGASLRMDTADARVLQDVKNGTGTSGEAGGTTVVGLDRSWYGIIDSQTDVGGWPAYTATEEELSRTKDTDGDGIPDYYEDLFGLNKEDKNDALKYNFDDRYTNLEMYLHYLVQDITVGQVAGGVATKLN